MSKRTLKAILMGAVFIAAVVFSAISFCRCEIVNGFGYILTALIPVTIWLSMSLPSRMASPSLARWLSMTLMSSRNRVRLSLPTAMTLAWMM